MARSALAVLADVADEAACERVVEAAVARFGRVDVLVNNAARGMRFVSESFMTAPTKFWEVAPAMWRLVVDTNVNGPFLMARAVVPRLIAQGWGRVVNVSVSQSTYVIMGNHLHLVVEADDQRCLARGLQGLTIRLAKRLNRAAGRRGRFFADRYHAHILRTPTEVHHALAYVLLNQRKHAAERRPSAPLPPVLDAFSSGPWFQGWHSPPAGLARLRRGPPPVVLEPRSWLLREGWTRAGRVHVPA